jgi:SAM-dependent methyltransferase
MTQNDIAYFDLCRRSGLVSPRLLEVGSAKVQGGMPNVCDLARNVGINETKGADIEAASGVDLVCDFSTSRVEFQKAWQYGEFQTVVIFNVLEHTFDPLNVFANALHCLAPGGHILVVVPSIWPLHDYPRDYVRLMPHWFETVETRFNLRLHRDAFCWLSDYGISQIKDDTRDKTYSFPRYYSALKRPSLKYWMSWGANRLLRVAGSKDWAPHCAIGAAFARSGAAAND